MIRLYMERFNMTELITGVANSIKHSSEQSRKIFVWQLGKSEGSHCVYGATSSKLEEVIDELYEQCH